MVPLFSLLVGLSLPSKSLIGMRRLLLIGALYLFLLGLHLVDRLIPSSTGILTRRLTLYERLGHS